MSRITLATLPQATAQEVFDQVARHLLTQGKRSKDSDGVCAYRGEDGLSCAAGCLIADEEYRVSFEHRQWAALSSCEEVPKAYAILIYDLQRVHDRYLPYEWPDELRWVASSYDLSNACLDEFPSEAA